ncbi:hypothetical protein NA57DRAFT_54664 [Rhizodiscina lignyota]|uniref:Ima1 N-terminal domain-containing protein n=1 Tax=Rhizodiscina lignyota TaxID=1504668 RepID=A0A9P4M817_9PEZI|nr:hypothetical protein NA57DRAFT_54664 [Rhizodiscina lignyota]
MLRRNLACFYCNQRSSQKYSRGLKDWQCEKCGSTNFLDENGEITDPPAQVAETTSIQYAQSAPRHTSPELDPPSDPIFCTECIKNQQLYTQAVANYYPPDLSPTDPEYAKYEAAFPAYERNLQIRYPQVCAKCEPRVRARMQAAGYAAKTDHLRRMLERARGGNFQRHGVSGWRGLLVTLGGIAWWSSIILQLAWHLQGAMIDRDPWYMSLSRSGPLTLFGCVRGLVWSPWVVERRCFAATSTYVHQALIVAALSMWWNPRLMEKISRANVRMTGLSEHLTLQLVVQLVRTAAWWMLQDSAQSLVPQRAFGGAHAFMVAFLILSTITSLRTVKIDDKPRVLFTNNIGPLIPENESQKADSVFSSSGTAKPTRQSQSSPFARPSFPVGTLDRTYRSAFNDPPTPPPDDLISEADTTTSAADSDTFNTMDWSPTVTQTTFQPRNAAFNSRTPQANQQQLAPYADSGASGTPSALGGPSSRTSAFYGTLPPAPKAPAAKLRNPWKPGFQRASAEKKENFFAQMKGKKGDGEDNPLLNADPYSASSAQKSKGYLELAEPKWQLKEEPAVTGLEGMFNSVFSINDEPSEVRAEASPDASADGPNRRDYIIKFLLWALPLTLGVAFAALKFMGWDSFTSFGSHGNGGLHSLAESAVPEAVHGASGAATAGP